MERHCYHTVSSYFKLFQAVFKLFQAVFKLFSSCFQAVSKRFPSCIKAVSSCFKLFQAVFKLFSSCFQAVSKRFPSCIKAVSSCFKLFQAVSSCFKTVSVTPTKYKSYIFTYFPTYACTMTIYYRMSHPTHYQLQTTTQPFTTRCRCTYLVPSSLPIFTPHHPTPSSLPIFPPHLRPHLPSRSTLLNTMQSVLPSLDIPTLKHFASRQH